MTSLQCKNCGNDEYKTIYVQTQITKRLKAGFMGLFIFFAFISLIGLIITIDNTIKMQSINAPTIGTDDVGAIAEYIASLIVREEYKSQIYIGIAIFSVGFVCVIFTAVFYTINPVYDIKTQRMHVCTKCGEPLIIQTDIENEE